MQKQALSQLAVYVAIVETMFNNSEELVTKHLLKQLLYLYELKYIMNIWKLLLLHLTFMNHVTVQRIVLPGSKEETRHPLSYQIHMK